MLTKNEIKVAVVMIGRANCTGQEAKEVAALLDKLVTIYNRPATTDAEPDVDDTATD